MRQKSMSSKDPAEKVVRGIRRKSHRQHSTEEKIRIVLEVSDHHMGRIASVGLFHRQVFGGKSCRR